jgi:hypothetical protein
MKNKKPGRVKLNCSRCPKPFSTHSTNRSECYKCKPKCAEKHYFDELLKSRQEKERQLENKKS